MAIAGPHILLEMSDEPDCRFVAAWLFRAAQAQSFWTQALSDREFADDVGLLHAEGDPDLAAFALEIFGELEYRHHVAILDLYSYDNIFLGRELGLMERLGFFTYGSQSYWMVLPKTITLAMVKRAALEVLSTVEIEDGLEIIHPERLLQTLPKSEAEALRARLIALRRFNSATYNGEGSSRGNCRFKLD